MFLLITYDVNTEDRQGRRRLRKVAQACEDYGQRVQYSVFECQLGKKEFLKLKSRLLKEMDVEKDSIRIYNLNEGTVSSILHFGIKKPLDLEGDTLIV